MLTLNSGICGTVTEQIEFYAHGSLIPQTQFDAGVAYFAKLKQLSSLHLRSCGLVFSSDDPTVEQIVRFAVRSHSGQGSTGVDKVLTGLRA